MKTEAFSKSYGGCTVLELPALELPEGQITAVIGANGSGKTTLARVLAGIEPPDRNTRVLPPVTVGYMPQKSYAFRMSTARNVLLNGGDAQRAQALMRAMRIEPLSHRSAKKLSGGESARMALCRLLMGDYQLILLDEPTASMDMETTLAAEELIRDRCTRSGCAMLLITHSIQQARRIADRALFLAHGTLVEQGAAEQVLRQPQAIQTKRFLEFYGL